MKPPSIFRVISLKMNYDTNNFDALFNLHFAATKSFFNEIIVWGEDSVFTKTGYINLTGKRKELYELTNKSISYENFSTCIRFMYQFLLNVEKPRGSSTSFLGTPKKYKEVLSDADYKEIKSSVIKDINPKFIYKCSNTLSSIGFKNRFPFKSDLTSDEKFSVISNVHRMLSSWHECDKLAFANYTKAKKQTEVALDEVGDTYKSSLVDFFNASITNNWLKHFDQRVYGYVRDCLIPNFIKNTKVTEHFYINKNDKVPYSLHEDWVACLKRNDVLWKGEDPVILKTMHLLEKEMNFRKLHEHAFYPFISDTDTSRVQYLLGKNFTKYTLVPTGKNLENTESINEKNVTDNFVDGIACDRLALTIKSNRKTYDFSICTMQRYDNSSKFNPNPYLKDANVWHKKGDATTNMLKFTKRGKEVSTIIKEPSIIKTDNGYDIRLNMRVESSHNEKLNKLSWFLRTSYPTTVNSLKPKGEDVKNLKRFNAIKGMSCNILGIDLGISTPFSWTSGSVKIDNFVNTVKLRNSGEFLPVEANRNNLYYDFKDECKHLIKIIGIIKSSNTSKTPVYFNNVIGEFLNKVQKYLTNKIDIVEIHNEKKLKSYQKFCSMTFEEIQDEITNGIKNSPLIELKKDSAWIPNIIMKYVRYRFHDIKDQNKFYLRNVSDSGVGKVDFAFQWLMGIELFMRLTRSISYLGENTKDENWKPIVLRELKDYYNGVKDNLLKVICAEIVKVAIKEDCSLIAVERLETMDHAVVLNKRNENFLKSLWSPARIKNSLTNAAEWHGIGINEVSESQTSQVHHESGSYGFRKGKYLYYYDVDGNICKVNADINASKNILAKGACRETNHTQVSKSVFDKKDDAAKEMKGMLSYRFGSLEEAKKHLNEIFKTCDYAYFHKGKWISKDERRQLAEEIQAKVESEQQGGTKLTVAARSV